MPDPTDTRTIAGRIVHEPDADLAPVTVQAFERDLPTIERARASGLTRLGSAVTDARGNFQITFTAEQFAAASDVRDPLTSLPDISFRVFDPAGRELLLSRVRTPAGEIRGDQILFNTTSPLEVTLVVVAADPDDRGSSEFERLLTMIGPATPGVPPQDLADDDVDFLVHEIGLLDQQDWRLRIEWLRRAARLSAATAIPCEAFYGWGRMNLPAAFADVALIPVPRLTTVLDELGTRHAQDLTDALRAAVHTSVIPERFRDRIDDAVRGLLHRNDLSQAVFARLRDGQNGAALSGCTVTTLEGDRILGTDITDASGHFTFYVTSTPRPAEAMIQRRFSFRVVTADGQAIEPNPSIDVDADQLASAVLLVDVAMPHPPAVTLAEQLKPAGLEMPESLVAWLNEQAIGSLADIRRQGGRLAGDGRPEVDADIIGRLEALAELDRIATAVTVTSTLVDAGYRSVREIAAAPASEFVASVTVPNRDLDPQLAAELHATATVQTMLLNNILAAQAAAAANGLDT